MKKFKLIGSYDAIKVSATFDGDLEIVTVPLLTSQGLFDYGVGNVLHKMLSNGICPNDDGIDIMFLATLVYLADTRISREKHSQDTWTREIEIQLPVRKVKAWNEASPDISRMLAFLTGDKWSVVFTQNSCNFDKHTVTDKQQETINEVTLFSGGMDSLISTINLLEEEKNVILISHAGEGFTKNSQTNILKDLGIQYPENTPLYLDLWMVFDKEFIPNGETENSTRSRSFLFIAFAVFAITGINGVNKLQVPENGLIALNVPLDDLRIGSHSTRTTHPFYLGMWNKILKLLGLDLVVENPYWNKTKGEMAAECLNKKFLSQTMGKSASCSSPIKARWKGLPPQHCGYCVPCLIRRAAMNRAFGFDKDNTIYTQTSVKALINGHANGIGVQLRSFLMAIKRVKDEPIRAKTLIYKTGPLENDAKYLQQLSDVYTRGLFEVDAFIGESLKIEENNETI